MGRQLAFWKYEEGVYLDNKEVYKKSIGEGVEVPGLSFLPKDEILNKIKSEFKDYERLDEYNYGGELGSFTVFINSQSVMFDCSFRIPETELNKMIDIMLCFGCPLYDPQIEVRFDGH